MERKYAKESLFYSENKRSGFFSLIVQLYHQNGEYLLDPRIGLTAVQYFMENPEKLDLDLIYESDSARFLMKDELEIKKAECLLEILRVLQDKEEFWGFIDRLIKLHTNL